MPLDPEMQAIVDRAAAAAKTVVDPFDLAVARDLYAKASVPNAPVPPAMRAVDDRVVPGPGGPIPVRVYTPETGRSGALPGLLYFHGGGWLLGSIATHDVFSRSLAAAAGAVVVSVDYRLAPEHKFPAAVEDAWAAIRWIARDGAAIGVDPARIAVAGDSAGGNLAAVICQLARDQDGPALAFQLLLYPTLDLTADTDSMRAFATGFLLTRAAMDWFAREYLADPAQKTDPRASPGRAIDLSRLAPALVVAAECDVLRDEARAYAERLRSAGGRADYRAIPGVTHGFIRMGGTLAVANRVLADLGEAMRALYAGR